MLNIAIVDDERSSIELLESYLKRFQQKRDMEYKVTTFHDGAELLEGYQPVYDVIFLDIEMKTDGIRTAEEIRRSDLDTILIFVTQMAQYAVKGYQVEALDYMVKPVEYYSFELVLRKILRHCGKHSAKNLMLNTGSGIEIVPTSKLYYVDVMGHYLSYHTEKGVFRLKGALSDLRGVLDQASFYQCNRYCIINLQYVTAIKKDAVTVNGDDIEVSRSKRKEILQVVTSYLGGDL